MTKAFMVPSMAFQSQSATNKPIKSQSCEPRDKKSAAHTDRLWMLQSHQRRIFGENSECLCVCGQMNHSWWWRQQGRLLLSTMEPHIIGNLRTSSVCLVDMAQTTMKNQNLLSCQDSSCALLGIRLCGKSRVKNQEFFITHCKCG